MARRLKSTVVVAGVTYAKGSTPSKDVAAKITNAKAWEDDGATPEPAPVPEEPPRAGAGATTEAWREYATQLGVQVSEDAGRDDIIAAVDAR